MTSIDPIDVLNAARASAQRALLDTTTPGRDRYRLVVQAACDAEVKWLADPANEAAEKAAAAAYDTLVQERKSLVKSIAGAKAAYTKRLNEAWAEVSTHAKK